MADPNQLNDVFNTEYSVVCRWCAGRWW